MSACSECDCASFVAHAFKKGQCRECFHPEAKHGGDAAPAVAQPVVEEEKAVEEKKEESTPAVEKLSVEDTPPPAEPTPEPAPSMPVTEPAKPESSAAPAQDAAEEKTEDTSATAPAPSTPAEPANDQGEAIVCSACGEKCSDDYLSAMSKQFHRACFKCTQCDKSLAGVPFVPVDGKPVCQDCHSKSDANPCAKCREPMTGQYVSAGDKQFHPDCFVCGECGKGFGNDPYYMVDGGPRCKDCVPSDPQDGKPCGGCGEEIDGEAVLALDEYFHPPCFKCAACEKAIEHNKFVKKDGKIQHEKCPE